MSEVPVTCPLIDELIYTLKFRCNHHSNQCTKKPGEPLLHLQTYNGSTVKDMIAKLEELREMNRQLRYNAHYWEHLYEASNYVEYEFNPEVLPPC